MPFNIAQWKEGDDPQLVIDFINEVMDDIRPSYSQPGWFTAEQEAEICKKYTPNNGQYSFTFYDGKILHVGYKDVAISFQKDQMMFEFTFENLTVSLHEDWQYYGRDTVYNSSHQDHRYNSDLVGFEDLLKIEGIDKKPITVVVSKGSGF